MKAIIEKIKLWFEKAGIVSVIYLILFLITLFFGKTILGFVGLKFLKEILAGAFLGIFLYINWNVIIKMWKTKVEPEIKVAVKRITKSKKI